MVNYTLPLNEFVQISEIMYDGFPLKVMYKGGENTFEILCCKRYKRVDDCIGTTMKIEAYQSNSKKILLGGKECNVVQRTTDELILEIIAKK